LALVTPVEWHQGDAAALPAAEIADPVQAERLYGPEQTLLCDGEYACWLEASHVCQGALVEHGIKASEEARGRLEWRGRCRIDH
jgi:hypothetical protein